MDYGEKAEQFRKDYEALRQEISRIIVGQHEIVEGALIALFAGGHCLLEGVPGLGKTLLVRSLSYALDVSFSRIQFTPDLMPADIIGTNMVMQDEKGARYFQFQKGPLFAHVLLADEINRATPKTQSALLEAMQEHRVTSGNTSYVLEEPFLVLATQNPLEMEGTYPLPEAQLDRFFFKLLVKYPKADDVTEILVRTTENRDLTADKTMDREKVVEYQKLVRAVPVAPHVMNYAVRLTLATHPTNPQAASMAKKYVRYGSSPRGAQALLLSGKVRALLKNRFNVSFKDIEDSVMPALRHRLILNFEAEAEGIQQDQVLQDLVETVKTTEE